MDIDGDPKAMARRLRVELAHYGQDVSHSQALELVAKAYGLKDWNTLAARPRPGQVTGGAAAAGAIPVLRVFGRDPAHAFYVDGLGFRLIDEQGNADLHEPVRMLVSLGAAVVQLTEHNDDASPGGAALIAVDDVVALRDALDRTGAVQALAGVEYSAGGPILVVVDPFRNRLVFHSHAITGDRPAAGPITHDLRVSCSPTQAFDTFTGRIDVWWPPEGYAPGPIRDVRIEPRVGGAVVQELSSGELYQWGTVLTWEPGRRYRQSFTMAQDPAHPSELDVRFVAEAGGTAVRFAHGGWTAGNLDRRTGFNDWPYILGRFAVLADGGDPNAPG
jgi:hypothetical protein